uniref:Uncharacterized protein n=1 Tax=Arundo donax TaxID=35708 RepID=A0A0A9H4Q3_ARUDO
MCQALAWTTILLKVENVIKLLVRLRLYYLLHITVYCRRLRTCISCLK